MNRWFRIAAVLGGLGFLGVGPAFAQSSERLHANIPFEFTVGGTVLPAGRYDVTYDVLEAQGVLVVRSQDGHHGALALTEGVDTGSPKREASLVFEREGSRYALSQVFAADAHTGLEIIGTHAAD